MDAVGFARFMTIVPATAVPQLPALSLPRTQMDVGPSESEVSWLSGIVPTSASVPPVVFVTIVKPVPLAPAVPMKPSPPVTPEGVAPAVAVVSLTVARTSMDVGSYEIP
jgi:hypothetical protein